MNSFFLVKCLKWKEKWKERMKEEEERPIRPRGMEPVHDYCEMHTGKVTVRP